MTDTNSSKLQEFLNRSTDLSIGYSEINFFEADKLAEEQVGYSSDDGSWNNDWIVIATDQMGAPIFIDTSSKELSVFTAMHGEGDWEPTMISDSLEMFQLTIDKLLKLSNGRESPVELGNNPIPQNEIDQLIKEIETINPNSEVWFWETFLEDES